MNQSNPTEFPKLENQDPPVKQNSPAQQQPQQEPKVSTEPSTKLLDETDPFAGVGTSSPHARLQDLSKASGANSENGTAESKNPASRNLVGSKSEVKTISNPSGSDFPRDQALGTDFDLLRWMIPVAIFVALIVGFMVGNRRRSRPPVQIDLSKPVRGAFQKRSQPHPDGSSVSAARPGANVDPERESEIGSDESDADAYEFETYDPRTDLGIDYLGAATFTDSDPESRSRDENGPQIGQFDFKTLGLPEAEPSNSGETADDVLITDLRFEEQEIEAIDHASGRPDREMEVTPLKEDWVIASESDTLLPPLAASPVAAVPHVPEKKTPPSVFRRLFGRVLPSDDRDDANSEAAEHEIGNFHVADEDLGSLFLKSRHGYQADVAEWAEQADRSAHAQLRSPGQAAGLESGGGDSASSRIKEDSPEHEHRFAEWAAAMQDQISALQADKARLLDLLESAKRELEAFSAQQSHQLEEHRLEQQNLTDAMEAQRNAFARLQGELSETHEARLVLRKELEELKGQFHELEVQGINRLQASDELAQSIAQLKNELAETALERNSLRDELERLATQSIDRLRESDALACSIAQLKSELAATSEERNSLRCDLERLAAQSVDRLRESDTLASSISQLQADLTAISQERTSLHGELAQLKAELRAMEQNLENSDRELRSLQAQNDELSCKLLKSEEALANLVSQNSELESEIHRTLDAHQQEIQRVSELERQLSEMTSRNTPTDSVAAEKAISRHTKEKFTRLFHSYERERSLRKEAERFLDEAEQQIVQLRSSLKKSCPPDSH